MLEGVCACVRANTRKATHLIGWECHGRQEDKSAASDVGRTPITAPLRRARWKMDELRPQFITGVSADS